MWRRRSHQAAIRPRRRRRTCLLYTSNPANGQKEFYGDYLVNAQGEDVVAGIRNTSPIAELKHVAGLEEAGKRCV